MASVFGFEVESDLPLGRLRSARGPRGSIRISLSATDILGIAAEITAIDWLDTPEGSNGFVIGRADGKQILGCSATGGYRLNTSALEIEVNPAGEPEMWEHRLLSVIAPVMLASRGDLVLHAAVVEIARRAVILCGPPMRGKSTLALTFAQLGHAVLSEDGAVIERRPGGWTVWPAASGARIRTETENGPPTKVVTTLPGPEARQLDPAAIVLLEPRGRDGIPSVADRHAALLALAPHLMHAGGVDAVRPAFRLLAELISTVPVMRASLPDDLDRVSEAAQALAIRVDALVEAFNAG